MSCTPLVFVQSRSHTTVWLLVWCRGANFGLVAMNNVTRVTYRPNEFTHIEFEARQCNVTMDHIEVTCFTDPGAGRDLRWDVRIANQNSRIISTNYAIPEIYSVVLGHRPDSDIIDTTGGELLIITGVYVTMCVLRTCGGIVVQAPSLLLATDSLSSQQLWAQT